MPVFARLATTCQPQPLQWQAQLRAYIILLVIRQDGVVSCLMLIATLFQRVHEPLWRTHQNV